MTWEQAGQVGALFLAALVGAWSWWTAQRAKAKSEVASQVQRESSDTIKDLERALKAKEEVIAAKQELAEANFARWEREHVEFKSYRDDVHNKANETQNLLLQQTSEIAMLRVKTDITPILEHSRQSMERDVTILENMGKITRLLNALMARAGLSIRENDDAAPV
jgi:hypothetical protein